MSCWGRRSNVKTGFLIEGGRPGAPVSEMNVSGNQLELWKRLRAVGADPYPYAAARTPSLAFDDVQVSGA
jgi:PmbA protein